MNTILITIGLMALAGVAVGMFGNDFIESMEGAMSTKSIKVTNISINEIGDANKIITTIENSGTVAISNMTVVVHGSDTQSEPMEFSTLIGKSKSFGFDAILIEEGTGSNLLLGEYQEAMVVYQATTIDGSTFNTNVNVRVD